MNSSGSEESVTLTKAQLWAILEAIGKTSGTNHVTSTESNSTCPLEKLKSIDADPKQRQQQQQLGSGHSIDYIKQSESASYPSWSLSSDHHQSNNTMPSKVSTPLIGETNRVHKRVPSPTESVSSKSTMSKLEQKRLQWEKERAEMQEWNPWGRPGGGAPVRKPQQVAAVAPITEAQLLMVHNNSHHPSVESSRISTSLPSHSYLSRNIPPAMRSSIPFGTNNFGAEEENDRMRREWLQEMEHDRKVREISGWLGETTLSENGTWTADHTISKTSTDPRSFVRGHGQNLDPVTAAEIQERHQKALEYQQAIRAQMEEKERRKKEEQLQRMKEEQEEERRLQEERARLQQQYEQEQQKIKEKEEQERKKREALIAAMEEAHAAAEAAKKARKSKVSNHSSQNSSANVVKGQHSTASPSPVILSPATALSPVQQIAESIQNQEPIPSQALAVGPSLQLPQEQAPEPSPTLPSSNQYDAKFPKTSHEIGVQARLPTPAFLPYVQNRILTPSRFRIELRNSQRNKGREFGTQTDLSFPSSLLKELANNFMSSSPTSSEQSSPTHVPATSNRNRPLKATWKNSRPKEELPKWGSNNVHKTSVKMADQNRENQQHRMFQNLRKQHWEKEKKQVEKSSREREKLLPVPHCATNSGSEVRSVSTTPQNTDQDESAEGHSKGPLGEDARSYATYTVSKRPRSYSLENIPSNASENEQRCPQCQHSLPKISNDRANLVVGLPPQRRQWHSQDVYKPAQQQDTLHAIIPSVEGHEGSAPNQRRKWSDQESFDLENVTLSKAVTHCRHSGNDEEDEAMRQSGEGTDGVRRYRRPSPKNPLFYPEVVTSQPTPRQDKILQQLAVLRQGLLQKQRQLDVVPFSRERTAS